MPTRPCAASFPPDYLQGHPWITFSRISTKKEKTGDIYIIADFSEAFITDAVLCSWRFAPEKLMMGIQKKQKVLLPKIFEHGFMRKLIYNFQLVVHGGILTLLMTHII